MKGENLDKSTNCKLTDEEKKILEKIHSIRKKKMPLIKTRYDTLEQYKHKQLVREDRSQDPE